MSMSLITMETKQSMDGFYTEEDIEYEENKLHETREQFAIRSSQLCMELERALEKIKHIEAMLRKEIEPTTNKTTEPMTTIWNDTFRPDPESRPPPNKRMKIEIEPEQII